MYNIINLTQHPATTEQRSVGVVDLPDGDRKVLIDLITFSSCPTQKELHVRAEAVKELALRFCNQNTSYIRSALIGGAPYLMAPLEEALFRGGLVPVYSFSERCSVEETLPDGTVRKVNTFRHVGFVSPAWHTI